MQVIQEAQEEERRSPATDEEEEKLEKELLHYGAEQAKKKGITKLHEFSEKIVDGRNIVFERE